MNLLNLAHAADHVSDWARHCLADIDAGRESKIETLREYVERLKAEIEVFESAGDKAEG